MLEPNYKDVKATPTTLQFNDAPRSYQVEHFVVGLENPINVEAIKEFFASSIMLKIPRFTSLLVRHNNRHQSWKRTRVDINQHFVVIHHDPNLTEEEAEDAINSYVAELAWAPPMSTDKPLWEIHVLADLRCLVLRFHHAIGDGSSMASLIREMGTEKPEKVSIRVEGKGCGDVKKPRVENWRKDKGMLGLFKYIWFSTLFFVGLLVKFVLIRDKKTVLNDKDYVDNWPQKLATVRFKLEEVKLVKRAIPNVTVNDILCGVIWGGFLKYINSQSSTGIFSSWIALKEGQQITGVLMASLGTQSSFQDVSALMKDNKLESYWGNKTSLFLLPTYYTKKFANPLDYVRKAKLTLDRKKRSMEPLLIYKLRNLIIRLFGVKVMNCLIARGGSHVTFGFSNVVGPSQQISIANNPVKFLRLSVSSSPLRIVMHLLSYTNNLDLQILVAEEVIPDPKLLANCFRDTFQEMKDVVNQLSKPNESA